MAWNGMQEAFLHVFCQLVDGGMAHGIATKIWHSTANDRAQREMLKAACEHEWGKTRRTTKTSGKITTEATYNALRRVLIEANKLSDGRNSIIHSPYAGFSDAENQPYVAMAMWFTGNPRSKQLHEKGKLFDVLRSYHDRIEKLTAQIFAVRSRIHHELPSPDKPRELVLPPKSSRPGRSRQLQPKSQKHQPES
jgi:hypothetical protein